MKSKIAKAVLPAVIKMQISLEKLRLQLVKQDFNVAGEQDIYYCYRLFLNRRPDPAGYQTYKNLIKHHGVTVDYLTDSFLYCDELQEVQDKRSQPVLVELPDFQLYVRLNDRFIGAAIAKQKTYEPQVTQIVRDLLQPGATFLDIGANIGYFSMLAAACLQNTGRVIAFEPVEQNRELFNLSVQANNFQNIELHPHAVSDSEQTFALDIGGRNSNSRIISVEQGSGGNPQVTAVPLDTFLRDLTALDLIKIDIEGAEPLALKGMRALVAKHRPIIISEFSPDLITQTSQVEPVSYLDQLVELGYTLRIIDDTGQNSEAQTPQQIIARFAKTADLVHVDLLAVPAK